MKSTLDKSAGGSSRVSSSFDAFVGVEEKDGGERQERQVSRRAVCWEWLKTRSERRMRSNFLEPSAGRLENRDVGGDPHVKPLMK